MLPISYGSAAVSSTNVSCVFVQGRSNVPTICFERWKEAKGSFDFRQNPGILPRQHIRERLKFSPSLHNQPPRRNTSIMKLMCAIVGGGTPFPVDIHWRKLVGELKRAIEWKKRSMIECLAKELHVFLAKNRERGEWLRDADDGVLELREGWIHPDIQVMIKRGPARALQRIRDELSANGMTVW
jgi:hypothetical protein